MKRRTTKLLEKKYVYYERHEERSRIRIQIRTHSSEVRIRGSGSATKWHGYPTLVNTTKGNPILKQVSNEMSMKIVHIVPGTSLTSKTMLIRNLRKRKQRKQYSGI
jgi:uncharacterized protein YggU (UPF0235/DUF167 family)